MKMIKFGINMLIIHVMLSICIAYIQCQLLNICRIKLTFHCFSPHLYVRINLQVK